MRIAVTIAALAASLLASSRADAGGVAARFLAFGTEADAPNGYVEMCAREPRSCDKSPDAPLTRDGNLLDLLKRVTRAVNGSVVQRSDLAGYGVDEYWGRPGANGGGDCEDIAIEKRVALLQAGFPADRLFYAVTFRRDLGLHTVLIARLDDGDYVLDNLTSRVDRWSRRGYKWLRLQSPADPRVWTKPLAA